MRAATDRRGLSAVEVIIAAGFVLIATACLLVAIPRSREASRRAGCQRNLMQIGLALGLYHQSAGHLPGVRLDGPSPFAAMLETLAQPDFSAFRDPKVPPPPRGTGPIVGRTIPGLLCPTDRQALGSPFPAPVSYRANTGDTTDGQGGPFAIGRVVTREAVEAADGVAYTAAFSERLVGEGRPGLVSPASYAIVPAPVGAAGCGPSAASSHRGDAGSSWLQSEWRSTLYSHIPTALGDSCIADDARTAHLGASSDHPEGFHVLLLDGSLRTCRPSIDPGIWRSLGTIGEPKR